MANLLIIDDDKDLCEVIGIYLEEYFDNITFAHSVPEGIGKIKVTQFNLIITDLNLISGNGLTLIKYARREDSPNYKTPIIVVSGEASFDKKAYASTSFLSKPFDQDALISKIRELKGNKKSETGVENVATHPNLIKLLKGS